MNCVKYRIKVFIYDILLNKPRPVCTGAVILAVLFYYVFYENRLFILSIIPIEENFIPILVAFSPGADLKGGGRRGF